MTRLRLDIAYNGKNFHGWAAQPDVRTVEAELRSVLELVNQAPIALVVAGRTDAGVHASGQVAHCDIADDAHFLLRHDPHPDTNSAKDVQASDSHRSDHHPIQASAEEIASNESVEHRISPFTAEQFPLTKRLNAIFASRGIDDIVIPSVTVVPDEFNARFSALDRTYCYRIADSFQTWLPVRADIYRAKVPTTLDVSAMDNAAKTFVGEHDFLAFAKPREGASTVREIFSFDVHRNQDGLVECWIKGDAFCHSQVRFMVGALIDIGRGLRDKDWLQQTLVAMKRTPKVQLAPACGLTLEHVSYPETADDLAAQEQKAKRVRTLS